MGGDEFVVLLPESDRDALERKAQLFCDIVVAVGHEVCGDEVLSLSVGESFFPHDGSDAEELLAQADKRMYQVKRTHHSSAKLSSEKPVQLALTPAG
jgi:diguanylate cyclase (GGDEF)-like protein